MGGARFEGSGELRLFLADHLEDLVALVDQVRVGVLHDVDHDARGHVHERFAPAEEPAVPYGATEDAAQDVAAALVGRRYAVRDEERYRAGVIGNHLVAEPLGFEGLRVVAEELTHRGVDRREQVRVVVRRHLLDDAREPLQTHAGIDGEHR
jgi:hypothetical protein